MSVTSILTSEVIDTVTPAQLRDLATLASRTDLGLSSAGMVRWAAAAGPDIDTYAGPRPLDRADLDRCERAYAASPHWLAERIIPLLEHFRAEINAAEKIRAKKEAKYASTKQDREAGLQQEQQLSSQMITATLSKTQWTALALCVQDVPDFPRLSMEQETELRKTLNELADGK